jgi:hypothetical protein
MTGRYFVILNVFDNLFIYALTINSVLLHRDIAMASFFASNVQSSYRSNVEVQMFDIL